MKRRRLRILIVGAGDVARRLVASVNSRPGAGDGRSAGWVSHVVRKPPEPCEDGISTGRWRSRFQAQSVSCRRARSQRRRRVDAGAARRMTATTIRACALAGRPFPGGRRRTGNRARGALSAAGMPKDAAASRHGRQAVACHHQHAPVWRLYVSTTGITVIVPES